jgi:hypothetical protein
MSHDDSTHAKPPIDWDAITYPQDFDNLLHAKKILTHAPLRKPLKHEWVRTHRTWNQPPTAVLRLQGDRKDDLYLLTRDIVPAFPPDLIVGMTFVPTITLQGSVALWPLRMPSATGRPDIWARTALDIAQVARERWVQLHSDPRIGAYTFRELTDITDDPVWPDLPWPALRELAFRDHVIDTLDHPVLQMVLRGR